jgi:hypothetical protein
MARDPVCIGCGQATGPLPRLNLLPDGRVCPKCRDRLLDTLPPVLPGFGIVHESEASEGWEPDAPYSPESPGDFRA